MTVRRENAHWFDMPLAKVAAAVRVVLTRRPPYIDSVETQKDVMFTTIVKPSWWLLGTKMTIELQATNTGTEIVASTVSQGYIMGDVFNYYDQYLLDLFNAVRRELRKGRDSLFG